MTRRLPARAAAVLAAAMVCGCDGGPTGAGGSGGATVYFGIRAATSTRLVSVEVTGPGIAVALVANIALDPSGAGSGTLRVPAGGERRVVAAAFDLLGVRTHQGDTTVTLVAGTNPALSLVLRPLNGSLPVVLTFGGSGVTLTPGDTAIAVGDTVRYTGGGLDSLGGAIDPAAIVWASTNPSIAAVSTAGLVRGIAAGTAYVLASFGGAAAGRRVTVR